MVTYSRFGIESIAASGLATFRKPLRFLSSTRQRTLVIRASKRPGRNALSPLHSINKICQKLVSCREEAPPESRSQGNQSLALLLSGAILTCWPYPVEAGDGWVSELSASRQDRLLSSFATTLQSIKAGVTHRRIYWFFMPCCSNTITPCLIIV